MKFKVLFIADDINKFNINTDTTYLSMLTCRDMGVEVYYCNQQHLFMSNYNTNCTVKAKVYKVLLQYGCDKFVLDDNLKRQWYKLDKELVLDLKDFDAVLVRKDPPFDLEYYMMTQVLNVAIHYGAKIYNNPHALMCQNEKLATLQFPKLIAPFIISKDKKELLTFIENHNDSIIKPINMMAGAGVIKTSTRDPNLLVLLELSSNNFTTTIMVQKFIPAIQQGDKRVFIINGALFKYCLIRTPKANNVRSNVAVGGSTEVVEIDDNIKNIAMPIIQWSLDQGINLIGLDIIGNYLNEINITSPTGLCQLYRHSGVNGAKLWLESCLQIYDD